MKQFKNGDYVDPGKTIGVIAHTINNQTEPLHTHDFIEIVYIMSGSGVHTVDGEDYSVKSGDVLFMNYGCTHTFFTEKEMKYVNIIFTPEGATGECLTPENAYALLSLVAFNEMRGSKAAGIHHFAGNSRKEIDTLINSLLYEIESKNAYYYSVMQGIVNIIIIKMLRKANALDFSEDGSGMWEDLLNYIDDNIEKKLTLSDLAKQCFYNPSYFSRVFKKKYGISFKEYIIKRRISYAMDLIEKTDLSINEIIKLSGFDDRSNFYSMFYKYTYKKPNEIRKENK